MGYLEIGGKEIEISEETADKIETALDTASKACFIFAGGCICWAVGHLHGQRYMADQLNDISEVAIRSAYYQGWHDALKAAFMHIVKRG